jgi:hypothetical protein
MRAERREEGMAAKRIKTYYSEVEHLESFWEAVFNFIAVKEAEGKRVASDLMTECVATSATLLNVGNEGELMPRTSGLQEKAVQSLWAFLEDPALTPEGEQVSLLAVWETAKV